ncbi:MAG: bifunctional [glutamine synthetase] adenylyltransferase/[glutamine synthetase]-adenylyl-L-tyrosine phosphorylase [Acidipropionibacterium jensenii]|uniref:bifunctional [glutamine synthetase] adenylyltransferase/[glutamine synthetase]-adenylyl-L-tyrosine phosphorylase n=1 Tax=Acidipropionibacterium jensenii TaxID=1749 RepID=UPI002649ACD3|nr:bifunctional [glutamine synthetase] adenylyltransferase/[glutamine synthetase]-adenylyl-L-tyrosine phosphorylase [Acidipropionibacterium jensenii]MDN6513130.1 bifunctional [glutamine synthetase] adenylyltransferase/[glutamine synthetase]-adenylyl-L-tyrosine phosphorylase [Acidipropionibacterium jensenii]
MDRTTTIAAELARRGAADGPRAAGLHDTIAQVLDAAPGSLAAWEDHLEECADVDMALFSLVDIAEAAPGATAAALSDDAVARRLVRLLGVSSELGRHLASHPEDLDQVVREPVRMPADRIAADLLAEVGAAPDADGFLVAGQDPARQTDPARGADLLRLANRRHLVRIASRDVDASECAEILDDIAAELADLADAIIETALALARAQTPGHRDARLAVVAMGKCGAQELNYVSDVDVIHIAEPARPDVSTERAVTVAAKLAGTLTRICSARSAAGTIWQVDAALRPEGNAGPLVRTLDSMATYYRNWAKNWEFQALMKARPMAGDRDLGGQFCELVSPMVWSVGEKEQFVAQTRAMRTRVVSLIPAREKDREIKLGSGGLRDVEFTIQLLQLVHGRHDESLRQRSTLRALAALAAGGYISRGDAEHLDTAYRLERLMEHRLQLFQLRRTHLLPTDEAGLRRLARSLGLHTPQEVTGVWRATSRAVLRSHNRVFYSPLVEAVARIPSQELRLTPQAAEDRMRALGFADPRSALRHIEALTQGTTRAKRIQAQLMPVMLEWLANGPNPDAGMLAFRRVSESLGESHWYLRALRDEGAMAQRLAFVLSTSRYATEILDHAPETVQILVEEDLVPRGHDDILREMTAVAARHETVEDAVTAVRAVRRRELFRIVVANILDRIDVLQTAAGLSDLAGATVDAALETVSREVDQPPRIGVVAMGRWGGGEMSYASDADAMFVVEDAGGAEAVTAATRIVTRVRSLLGAAGPDPKLDLDAGLRPEGRSGAMVRSLSSYRAYYRRWSSTWESQALLRARHGAGDRELTAALLDSVSHLRWPPGGLTAGQLGEIRKLKARMEAERIPRGVSPHRHLKMGPGGLADVEWTIQVMQLQHAAEVAGLQTTSTVRALQAALDAGLLSDTQDVALQVAWREASRMRNAILIVSGRASDVIPTDPKELDGIARLLGLGLGASAQVMENHLRRCRLASKAVDQLFWS